MVTKKVFLGVVALALGLSVSACSSTPEISTTAPHEYMGPKTSSGQPLLYQLQTNRPNVSPKIVFAVGECSDKTGKFLDGDQLRYSRAVTQACPDLLADYLRTAGFQVAERSQYNLGLIAQEYNMSRTAGNPAQRIGLVQYGGPAGGLIGANYMVTGAVTMYNTSSHTGGGGLDVDGIGISGQRSIADVGITLRIVDMSTGLVVSSLTLESRVTGKTGDLHLTRLIGDVANGLATVVSGGTSTTVLRPESNMHIITAELGGAMQQPIDYAVNDAIVASLARQLEANQHLFYTKPVRYYYDVPTD